MKGWVSRPAPESATLYIIGHARALRVLHHPRRRKRLLARIRRNPVWRIHLPASKKVCSAWHATSPTLPCQSPTTAATRHSDRSGCTGAPAKARTHASQSIPGGGVSTTSGRRQPARAVRPRPQVDLLHRPNRPGHKQLGGRPRRRRA